MEREHDFIKYAIIGRNESFLPIDEPEQIKLMAMDALRAIGLEGMAISQIDKITIEEQMWIITNTARSLYPNSE